MSGLDDKTAAKNKTAVIKTINAGRMSHGHLIHDCDLLPHGSRSHGGIRVILPQVDGHSAVLAITSGIFAGYIKDSAR